VTGIAGFYLRTQYRLDAGSDAIETDERSAADGFENIGHYLFHQLPSTAR
jgi:hypothetical protein